LRSLAVIVCNSGLGHLKRVLWILDALLSREEQSIEVNLFVDDSKLKSFEGIASKLPPLIRAGGERLPMSEDEQRLIEFYFVHTEIPEFSMQRIAEQIWEQ